MKHTPGPIRIHRDERGRGFELYGPDGREVCRINSRRTGAGRGMSVRYVEHSEDASNAALFASAPDLLAAAKEIISRTPMFGTGENYDALRAAIARAEGGAG